MTEPTYTSIQVGTTGKISLGNILTKNAQNQNVLSFNTQNLTNNNHIVKIIYENSKDGDINLIASMIANELSNGNIGDNITGVCTFLVPSNYPFTKRQLQAAFGSQFDMLEIHEQ